MSYLNTENIIQVEHLSKRFKRLKAVDDISFSVKRGQCFGLLGPNGAGKSTSIEMLEGITEKDSGTILFNGKPMDRNSLVRVGIQFQNTALQDSLTCRETLDLFSALYPTPLNAETLIEMCQLQAFVDTDHRKLSGGQRQRLLLALALVNNPDILFLDEPTTGLDPQARRHFWDLINHIKDRGKTILLTTHYMDEAEYLCDHIAIMNAGKIIAEGAPETLLQEHLPGAIIQLAHQELPELPGTRISEYQNQIRLTTNHLQHTLKLLLESDLELSNMQIKTANLDDLFLKLTGHGLTEQHP